MTLHLIREYMDYLLLLMKKFKRTKRNPQLCQTKSAMRSHKGTADQWGMMINKVDFITLIEMLHVQFNLGVQKSQPSYLPRQVYFVYIIF